MAMCKDYFKIDCTIHSLGWISSCHTQKNFTRPHLLNEPTVCPNILVETNVRDNWPSSWVMQKPSQKSYTYMQKVVHWIWVYWNQLDQHSKDGILPETRVWHQFSNANNFFLWFPALILHVADIFPGCCNSISKQLSRLRSEEKRQVNSACHSIVIRCRHLDCTHTDTGRKLRTYRSVSKPRSKHLLSPWSPSF